MARQPSDPNYVEHGIRRWRGGFQVRIGGQTQMAENLTEARRVRRQLENDREQTFGQGTSRETVGQYLTRWIATIQATKSAGTYRAWEPVVRLRILPHALARLKLSELSPRHIQDWIVELSMAKAMQSHGAGHQHTTPSTRPLSRRTQEKCFECLSAAIHDAMDQRAITRNPLVGIHGPKGEKYHATVWTARQIATFLRECQLENTAYTDGLMFAVFFGCRNSGICATLETDVDLESRTILIREGKTESSWRRLPMIAEAVILAQKAALQNQQEEKYWDDQYRLGPRYLFRRRSGEPLSERVLEKNLHRLAAKLSLPDCRVHDLRHYYGTAAKRAGVPDSDSARVMGHASPAITREIYQDVDSPDMFRALEAVANTWREHDQDVCPTCRGTGRVARKLRKGRTA